MSSQGIQAFHITNWADEVNREEEEAKAFQVAQGIQGIQGIQDIQDIQGKNVKPPYSSI
jgi:hypothetical protein